MRPSVYTLPVGRAPEPAAAPASGSALPADTEHRHAILESHERCAALGVSRIGSPDLSLVPRADLDIALERNRRLHEHALPVMAMLHDQIARTESMVVLTDSAGTILHAIGDDDFLGRASKVALRPGANWSEGSKGTNAVGTALMEEKPTLVHADEHYLHANSFLTCSAAPILDPRGNMLGVLDVSGDFRSYHQHTLALVRLSARMIENRWLTGDFTHALRLHFHSRADFIGTLMEGVLAVGENGRIVGANRGALEQLGMSGAALRMLSLESLFDVGVADLTEHFQARVATPLTLTAVDGRRFAAFVRSNGPLWDCRVNLACQVVPPEPATARRPDPSVAENATAPNDSPGALALLQTGDRHVDAVVEKVRRIVDRDIPLLILGETGTGKEVLARAVHADSARANAPFVVLNCASISEASLESELFGHADSAGAGARRRDAPGKIVQAEGGTLFLDQIGQMSAALQAHLLRVLQERQVVPMGSNRPLPVDVSIICAAHCNLRQMIERQAFRDDLYYRLNGLAVRLPPLRERSDMTALVRRILDSQGGVRRRVLAPEVQPLFERYGWPGNLRQLFQVLRAACAMAGSESIVTRAHLPDDFLEEADAAVAARRGPGGVVVGPAKGPVESPAPPPGTGCETAVALAPHDAKNAKSEAGEPGAAAPPSGRLEDLQLELIRRTLDAVGGNISEASKRLGISRNTIYRKLRWNQPGSDRAVSENLSVADAAATVSTMPAAPGTPGLPRAAASKR